MTSPAPLSEAEKAAARALAGDFECTWHIGCDEECHADRARAVVAAVRSSIEADALDRFADHLRALVATESFCDEAADSGMKLAASVAEDEAVALRQSLSLPASKETP